MNTLLHSAIALSPLLAAMPALADPFTARPLPAGFNVASAYNNGAVDTRMVHEAQAVDFLGTGKPQWYAGGRTISDFPDAGVRTLPAVTLPGNSAALPAQAGIPCDMDRDGDMDIVQVYGWSGPGGTDVCQVFLNNGSGTFTAGFRQDWTRNLGFDEGDHAYDLATADTDGDGDPDVIVTQSYENPDKRADLWVHRGRLFILLNDGTGQFTSSTVLEGSNVFSRSRCSAGDYDRDGDADILMTSRVTDNTPDWHTFIGTSRLHENNGSGSFTVTDLNYFVDTFVDGTGDGWLDVSDGSNLANNSNGVLDTPSVLPGASSKKAWVLAETSGDKYPDFAYGQGSALIRQTTWGASTTLVTLAAEIVALAAADGDGDGDVDYFATLANSSSVFVENRALHMAPGAAGGYSTVELAGVTALRTADFNRDGFDDLLSVTPSQNKFWIHYGEQDGSPAAPVYKLTQNEAVHSVALGDFDRDGRVDAAYSLPGSGQVRLARNNGNAPLVWTDSSLATSLTGVSHLATGQFGTPNAQPDLLTSSATTGNLRWLRKLSDGTWTGQNVWSGLSPAPGAIMAVPATSGAGDEPFILGANAGTQILRGYQLNPTWTGAGTNFSMPVTNNNGQALPSTMTWADVDQDGRKEAVFVMGDGKLGFWNPILAYSQVIGTPPWRIRSIAPTDWNRDGRTDFLCATDGGLYLCAWYHEDDGYLWTKLFSAALDNVVALDLNSDGWPDAAISNPSRMFFVRNEPKVFQTTRVSPGQTNLPSGLKNTAVTIKAASHGWLPGMDPFLGEYNTQVTGVNLIFGRLDTDGSFDRWLTGTELATLVSGVTLCAGETTIGSTGPVDYEANGIVQVDYHSVFGTLTPFAASGIQNLNIKLQLATNAHLSPHARFTVRVNSFRVQLLDGVSPPATVSCWDTAELTAVPNYTALQHWRVANFGAPDAAGLRANDADFDKDGVSNLVEYLAGTNPAASEPALNTSNALTILPFFSTASPLKCRLITGNAATADPKVRATIQISTGLTGWATLASRTGGGSWTGNIPISPVTGDFTNHVFTTTYTPLNTPKFYLRLKVEELP